MLQSLTSWQDRLNPLAEVEFSSQSREEIKSGKGGVRKTLYVEKVDHDYEDATAELLQTKPMICQTGDQ